MRVPDLSSGGRDLGTRLGPYMFNIGRFRVYLFKYHHPETTTKIGSSLHTDLSLIIYHRSGNFHVKNNYHDKFSRFRSIREIFFTVDNYNTDELLESSWRVVYYQVSGEPGIAGCSFRSDIFPGEYVDLRANLFTDNHCVILFFAC